MQQRTAQQEIERQEEELFISRLHSNIISLLGISIEEFSIQSFMMQINLLESILLANGIQSEKLTYNDIFLLTYYHIGCELRKKGIVRELEFERIKREKFNELEIDYHPISDTSQSDSCNKNFCLRFDAYLDKVKRDTTSPSCIGVV
ncbi:DUF3890 domain-containing protein (plasmid) [Borrelia puertoricensis]|uniref:DUF3890 domain-containing protein n=1 Tax=Borrelia puertoricensis TaxID=2756107 RepID=UPI001FF2A036|nr:DUF3890 domain-containing protein [Borrelia puertoricensis]UPA18361.1 DUF3890 domain-containing protein [Borrelia puertoricensis]UPA18397.1 DUF3890 domain-containing protein [Borrelia puertoricensis]UPA18438.1 DUF3890 domain-containing protein [Borrelia puertoricensis]UPA18475.1 DUF3890 domain-containing protein [Borrelia puertoricensis]UPA18519.1 DUF3890 domain-containing protein [Borrelia puertoricensis]